MNEMVIDIPTQVLWLIPVVIALVSGRSWGIRSGRKQALLHHPFLSDEDFEITAKPDAITDDGDALEHKTTARTALRENAMAHAMLNHKAAMWDVAIQRLKEITADVNEISRNKSSEQNPLPEWTKGLFPSHPAFHPAQCSGAFAQKVRANIPVEDRIVDSAWSVYGGNAMRQTCLAFTCVPIWTLLRARIERHTWKDLYLPGGHRVSKEDIEAMDYYYEHNKEQIDDEIAANTPQKPNEDTLQAATVDLKQKREQEVLAQTFSGIPIWKIVLDLSEQWDYWMKEIGKGEHTDEAIITNTSAVQDGLSYRLSEADIKTVLLLYKKHGYAIDQLIAKQGEEPEPEVQTLVSHLHRQQ